MTEREQHQPEGRNLRDDEKADWQKPPDKQPMVVANNELEQSVKRLRRLNGWHRIGITASVLWLFFGVFWGSKAGEIDQWRFDCISELDKAIDPRPVTGGLSVADWCIQQSDWRWPFVNYNTVEWYTALYALAPIVLGWLTVYGIIALVRWIQTGFKVPTSRN